MIAEVPSFAIETCYILDNTSVIQDEVLAQRLGLVPLRGNQEGMRSMKWYRGRGTTGAVAGAGAGEVFPPTIYDTLILHLEAHCERSPDDGSPTVPAVYARDIEWRPASGQGARFGDDPVRAASPDIVLTKLRPGQGITVTMHAVKGLGKDHAKFSPVATASYRLLPTIEIVGGGIMGKAAERFAACFPEGVVEVVDGEAKVMSARKDTVSREVLRHEEFRGRVELGRVRDHFIFSVESVGQWDADAVFLESVGVLQAKVNRLKRHTMRMLQLEAEKVDRETSTADEDQMEE
jgi:DNA-directed RNA polymerase I and III subunit RPAC1